MEGNVFIPDSTTLRLLDQVAIREVIDLYFSSVDRKDFAALTSCFTPEAQGEYDAGRAVYLGGKAIVEALKGIVAQFKFSCHMIANEMIKVDGDHAKTDLRAVSIVVPNGEGDKGRVLVRGLRYFDDLVRKPEGWQISHLVHIPEWQYESALLPPAALNRMK